MPKIGGFKDEKCVNFLHLSKLLLWRSLLGLCVLRPSLAGQDPRHGVVTQPGLALHDQHIARPGDMRQVTIIRQEPAPRAYRKLTKNKNVVC